MSDPIVGAMLAEIHLEVLGVSAELERLKEFIQRISDTKNVDVELSENELNIEECVLQQTKELMLASKQAENSQMRVLAAYEKMAKSMSDLSMKIDGYVIDASKNAVQEISNDVKEIIGSSSNCSKQSEIEISWSKSNIFVLFLAAFIAAIVVFVILFFSGILSHPSYSDKDISYINTGKNMELIWDELTESEKRRINKLVSEKSK